MPKDYSKITNEEFDAALETLVSRTTAGVLLSIPGIYEILSEHFNNEVLDSLCPEDEPDTSPCDHNDADGVQTQTMGFFGVKGEY